MEKKGRGEKFHQWAGTIAAFIAIIGGISGFLTLFRENAEMKKLIIQTTKIAIAADSQVTELRKHTKILEDQYVLNKRDAEINKNRYNEEIMPYFGYRYSETIEDMADGGDWLVNIGNKAKILSVEYGKNNTFKLEYPKNTFIEKGSDVIYLQPQQGKNEIRKIDIKIIMENMNGIKYTQRFYSDSKNVLFATKPIRIN
jgi:hypothetical protein